MVYCNRIYNRQHNKIFKILLKKNLKYFRQIIANLFLLDKKLKPDSVKP